jgi:hypothetical protein
MKSKNRSLCKVASIFQPFDYGYILEYELKALTKMAEFFNSDKTYSVDAKLYAKQIELAIKLLRIAIGRDSNYKDGFYYGYTNDRNCRRFLKVNPPINDGILLNGLREQKAWYLYNKMRAYKMQLWWD